MSKIIEQSQDEGIRQLFERVDRMETLLEALGHAEICLCGTSTQKSYPISTKELTVVLRLSDESWNKIKYFYKLEELILQNIQPHRFGEKPIPEMVSSSSVKKLTLINCSSFSDPIFIKNFPNLRELYINGMPALNSQFVLILRSINHKLSKLTFEQNRNSRILFTKRNSIKNSVNTLEKSKNH
jgi:hypothetical protein